MNSEFEKISIEEAFEQLCRVREMITAPGIRAAKCTEPDGSVFFQFYNKHTDTCMVIMTIPDFESGMNAVDEMRDMIGKEVKP